MIHWCEGKKCHVWRSTYEFFDSKSVVESVKKRYGNNGVLGQPVYYILVLLTVYVCAFEPRVITLLDELISRQATVINAKDTRAVRQISIDNVIDVFVPHCRQALKIDWRSTLISFTRCIIANVPFATCVSIKFVTAFSCAFFFLQF